MKTIILKRLRRQTFILIICLFFIHIHVQSQTPIYWEMGNTINFKDSNNKQYFKFDTNNVWIIDDANKYKNFLSMSSEYGTSIFTDTNTFYLNNIQSSFTIKLLLSHGVDGYSFGFYHKYDFKKNSDGGIIETSYDNGQTWQNIISDTVIINAQSHNDKFIGYYSIDDTIASYKNQPGFTGTDTSFHKFYVSFTPIYIYMYDTVLIRFTFSSDSILSFNEGWIIDDIKFGYNRVNVNKIDKNNGIHIYPNPTQNNIIIEFSENSFSNGEIKIFNMLGQLMFRQNLVDKTIVDISTFPQGMYILNYQNGKMSLNSKFLKK